MKSRYNVETESQLSIKVTKNWLTAQVLVWVVVSLILFNLIFSPKFGIQLFWNLLIPSVPFFLVVATGVWRNICPMAKISLFFSQMGWSNRKKVTIAQSGKMNLIAVISLFVIVPLRHAIFDASGPATALLIILLVTTAFFLGYFFDWKSVWCAGLCPIHPVEKLYGLNSKIAVSNAHCSSCFRCVSPCPDSIPSINNNYVKKTNSHKIATFLMIGAFPGFVWGWFQVQDYTEIISLNQIITIYGMPLLGLSITSILFLSLKKFFHKNDLTKLFSASAVSCYYWFRLPALFGYGLFPGDGMLVDLSDVLSGWMMTVVVIALTIFFFWWIVLGRQSKNSWMVRPVYADARSTSKRITL